MTKQEVEQIKPGDKIAFKRDGKLHERVVREWDYPGYKHILMVRYTHGGLIPVFPEQIRYYLPKKERNVDPSWRQQIIAMIKQGKSKQEITEALSLDEPSVNRVWGRHQKKS